MTSPGEKVKDKPCYVDEAKVREVVAQLGHKLISASSFSDKPDPAKDPIEVDLSLALGCIALLETYGQLEAEERSRLINRVNVLLRGHHLLGRLLLQVKE